LFGSTAHAPVAAPFSQVETTSRKPTVVAESSAGKAQGPRGPNKPRALSGGCRVGTDFQYETLLRCSMREATDLIVVSGGRTGDRTLDLSPREGRGFDG